MHEGKALTYPDQFVRKVYEWHSRRDNNAVRERNKRKQQLLREARMHGKVDVVIVS